MRSFSIEARALLFASVSALAGCGAGEGAPNPLGDSPLGNRPDLPVDQTLALDHLHGKVDVVRDTYGRPHVYAANQADAMRVEGYLVASDRAMQLEFYRRLAEGRLAEVLSDLSLTSVDLDIAYRHIGLARVAKAQYQALPSGSVRDALDAYADGVTQAFRKIRNGEMRLPSGLIGIPTAAFTDWTAVDSLAIARLQTYLLSYHADRDLSNQAFFDAARTTFTSDSTEPTIAKRAGLERDLFRFAPADPTTTTAGYPAPKMKDHRAPSTGARRERNERSRALLSAASGYLAAMKAIRSLLVRDGFGSNDWAIAPTRSATGHVLLASDPHLSLSAPAVLWPVSINVTSSADGDPSDDLAIAGLAFPGIPGIILGHNKHIAWGATAAGYDVSDAYEETLTADGESVLFKEDSIKLESVDEVINLQSGSPITYKVLVVPHHGPIVPTIADHAVIPPDPSKGAISIRWTGLEATHEIESIFALLRARSVDSARAALRDFGVGAQNWMIGDTAGHILWTSHANVPVRDTRAFEWDAEEYEGSLPCLVLPGDGTAEWTSVLGDDMVPWAKDPIVGYIATANNDPIGDTLDNDPSNDTLPDGTPMFLACQYDIGFREGKIKKRLESHTAPFTPADLAAIQGDEESSMGAALAPALVDALERAAEEKKTPGTHADLTAIVAEPAYDASPMQAIHDLLVAWGASHGYAASSGTNPDDDTPLPASGDTASEAAASQATLIFNAWLVRLMGRTFGDELEAMAVGMDHQQRARAILRLIKADPATLATYDPATGDSSLWDDLGTTDVVESRHERMIRALYDALGDLAAMAGPDIATYRWGRFHGVRFGALLPFWSTLSIPAVDDPIFASTGFPRHGDSFSIDASEFTFGSAADKLDFTYDAGPAQRFVVDMDPDGPKAWNALPGGVVWDPESPHFRDEAELWRRNQTHPVPFSLDDVIAAKESRTQFSPR